MLVEGSAAMLTDEVREKAVLALTSTTRKQCFGVLGVNQERCVLGVLAEALGIKVVPWNGVVVTNDVRPFLWDGIYYNVSPQEKGRLMNLLGDKLYFILIHLNDTHQMPFAECAKVVKDWSDEDHDTLAICKETGCERSLDCTGTEV